MSSFSSVVQKPGKKIVPKAAPRRNVQRRPAAVTVTTSSTSQSQDDGETNDTISTAPSTAPTYHEISGQQVLNEPQETRNILPSPTLNTQSNAAEDEVLIPDASRENPVAIPSPVATSDSGTARVVEIEELRGSSVERTAPTLSTSTAVSETVPTHSQEQIDSVAVPDASTNLSEEIDQQLQTTEDETPRQTRRRKASERADAPVSPKKRRKTTPRAAPQLALAQAKSAAVSQPLTQRLHDVTSQDETYQPPEDLFQSATQRAASVSELANSIELQTRSLRPRREPSATSETHSENEVLVSGKARTTSSRKKSSRRKKTAEEQAAEVIANVVASNGASARQRDETPEDAGEYELEPAKITMGDLCEDSKLGKKSALESEMQANWPEILQRRKEDRERALANAEKRRRKGIGQRNQLVAGAEAVAALAPAMAVVNGVIVVDQSSREIDRGAQLQQAAVQDLDNVREDKDYYKYINQNTVGVKPGHGHHSKWDDESNERFFKGLRMFGTDFLMIANMFPGLTRKQIKTKFIREENADKSRVLECLRNRDTVQLEDYAEMANKESEEFHTLESIQKELDEQERQLREEDNQRRKREGFVTTEDDANPQEPAAGTVEGESEGQNGSVEPSRFDTMAREIVDAAVAPKRRQRKTTSTSSRRGPKGGRRPEGGIEEILGSISEVAV